MTSGLHLFWYITYGNNVSFLLAIVKYFLLLDNYVIYLFDVVTIFYDVRTTLYFGTLEIRMQVRLHLRLDFVHNCDVFFITSQLRYLFVRCSYVF